MEDSIFYGCLPSPPDARDYQAKDYIALGVRPSEYEPDMWAPVLNQGSVGSCVAHSLATVKWYQEHRERKGNVRYSTDYIYHNRLASDHQGSGMVVREALSQLAKCGVCEYVDLPTNTEYPNKGIQNCIDALASEAEPQRVKSYVRCETTDEICEAIYQHGGAVVCVEVKTSFKSFVLKDREDWALPMPKSDERTFGYHAVCACGYTAEGIIIQNSWSEAWGHKGFAVLPWDYPLTEAWSVVDMVKDWDIVELKIGENVATINGEEVALDVPAVITNGRTMVPLRFVAEALGCDVEWIAKEQKVVIRRAK